MSMQENITLKKLFTGIILGAMLISSPGSLNPVSASEADSNTLELSLNEYVTYDMDSTGLSQWYSFACEEDGAYNFRAIDGIGEPEAHLYEADANGNLSVTGVSTLNYDGGFFLNCDLEAGKTYYFKVVITEDDSADTTGSFQLILRKMQDIQSIRVDSLALDTFTRFETVVYEEGSILTLTYEDGTSEQVVFDYADSYTLDSYRHEIYYCIMDGDTKYEPFSSIYLEDGTYSICFYTYTSNGEMISAYSAVSVVSPNMTEITLLNAEYAAEISATENTAWFSFTPATDGQYYFVSTIDSSSEEIEAYANYSLGYFDANGTFQGLYPDDVKIEGEDAYQEVYDSVEGKYSVYSLTAGVTYYYTYTYYDLTGHKIPGTVTVTAMQENTVIISATDTSTESSSESNNADNADASETNSNNSNSTDADSTSSAPQTGDANLPLFLLLAILGCIVTSAAAKEKMHR